MIYRLTLFLCFTTGSICCCDAQSRFDKEVKHVLHDQVLAQAAWAMKEAPVTITATACPRSAGGKHDFYSEADYFWPDPDNSGGPYINRDGMTYPGLFVDHRYAMIRFSKIVGALASAYVLTGDDRYATQALLHMKAWFVDTTTLMNPSLVYGQAIQGRVTGRGIGIIDTIHLMEVAQGLYVLQKSPAADKQLVAGIKSWFARYLEWLTTHKYGKDEMNTGNNHSTCWVMQVGTFARLTGNHELLDFCRDRYKTVLLPQQMATDGSFPLEIKRTKPYGYSLFNLDAMTMACVVLSDKEHDLWSYKTTDDKSIKKGIEYLFPYVKSKDTWPYPQDVMYWENWPVAHPFLLMGARKYQNKEWFDLWKKLDHEPTVAEVVRNLPVRNPVIWLN